MTRSEGGSSHQTVPTRRRKNTLLMTVQIWTAAPRAPHTQNQEFKLRRPHQVTRRRTRPLAVRSVRRMKTTELGTRKDFGDQCPVVLSVDHFLSAGFTLPESQCVLYEAAILGDLLEASCIAPLDNGSSQRVVGIGDELAYRNKAVWPQYPRKLP